MRSFFSVILLFISLSVQSQDDIMASGSELFGDLRGRHIGPALMSGRITDLEGHPNDSRIIYVGTAGGGVWKSSNGGASFNPVFDKHAQSIGTVTLDPSQPDKVIWVGTGETWTRNSVSIGNGIYKSNDGGINWKNMGLEKSERISSIIVNPNNPDEIFVGVLGALWSDSQDRGVYKSTNGGQSWEKIFYLNPQTGCGDLIVDPSNPKIMYASMWEFRRTAWNFISGGTNSAIYKTEDGGNSWVKIHRGLPEKGIIGRIAIAVAPSNPNILYTVIESEEKKLNGLYKSTDGGANWNFQYNDFEIIVRPFYFSRIVVSPSNPDILIKGGVTGSISIDGGKSFKSLGYMHPDVHDILFDLKDENRIYFGTDGGVYRSWDRGVSNEIVGNIPVSQFYHISIDKELNDDGSYNIYGGLQDNGSWYGPSSSPGGIEAGDWKNIGGGDGFRAVKHSAKNIVFSETQGASKLFRTDIDKKNVKFVQPLPLNNGTTLRFNWNTPILGSHHNPDRLYIGSQFLHRSDDMGNTWEIISPDLTTNDKTKYDPEKSPLANDNSGAENHCTIFSIAESPLDPNLIWIGTDDGNLQLTRNGGKSWTNLISNVSGLPKNSWVSFIETSPFDPATAFVVFDRHSMGDMQPYIFKTTDYGKTWTKLGEEGIGGFARVVRQDVVNQDLMYLGTELGLFISLNGGKNWNKFENNVPAVAIHHIELHPVTNDIVLATHGRGIIIIDDVSFLREANQEVFTQDVHFLKSKPAIMLESSGFMNSSSHMQFVGENPSKNARIIYYLNKRHTFGEMTIEIFDQNDKLLTTLAPGKSKGINIVQWNGRTRPPKIAKSHITAYGSFVPPRVPEGTYKVVLKKNKSIYQTTVEVLNDPNSVLTDDERVQNYIAVRDLYNLSEKLAYLVYEIDENLIHLEKIAKGNSKLNKKALAASTQLMELKKKLVITSGDNYVDRSEPQLREKISELYGKIAVSYDKPAETDIQAFKNFEKQFSEAHEMFRELEKNSLKQLYKLALENDSDEIKLLGFEEFIKM